VYSNEISTSHDNGRLFGVGLGRHRGVGGTVAGSIYSGTANGIAFSEFRDYEAWQMIATSQPDDASGCGTSKVGCTKAILGNAAMINAYRDGIPANGQAVPDGAAMAKIERLKDRKASPYGVTLPGTQTEVSSTVKDSKRFARVAAGGAKARDFVFTNYAKR
jgi:hypothetical protein